MQIAEQQAIRQKTAAIVVEWANDRQPPFTGETPEGFEDAITAAHLVADEGRLTLNRWVDAARRTGLSWSEIGDALGISKQAAQQRFKSLDDVDDVSGRAGEEIVRLGAHAFNEMRILRAEGQKGNELVRTGAFALVFRSTSNQWEYLRKIGTVETTGETDNAGWIYVSSWFPFHYFKRAIVDSEL
ncbi:MAG: hypothetical protein ABJP48_05925 [Erythrobacter sp.]